jgi:hypothetical protein
VTRAAHHLAMMTQQLGFSVLTAPIAAIDRRALSQAWYSALHLARDSGKRETPKPVIALKPSIERESSLTAPLTSVKERCSAPSCVRLKSISTRSGACAVSDRRSLRSSLARKIESVFLRPGVETRRATFTINANAARVHVTLARTARGLALVAVCAPCARETVARALEQARYALAARGIALDARVQE